MSNVALRLLASCLQIPCSGPATNGTSSIGAPFFACPLLGGFFALLLLSTQPSLLLGQPMDGADFSPRRALELDGNGSYVKLPADLLADLEEVTIEGWVEWASFQSGSRFFDFGGGPIQISVQNRDTTSTLWFESPEGNTYKAVTVPDLLGANEWIHVAAVRSTNGLQLVVNGVLMPTVPQSATVNTPQGTENLLGRSNFHEQYQDADFHGRMAEVRVWGGVRTEAEIRTNLFTQLTGIEPGLVALYNFVDVSRPGRDASGNGHDSQFMGDARIAVARLPTGQTLATRSVLNLNGTKSYVELPPAIFTNLTESTFEAWVKWRSLEGRNRRIIDYGDAHDDLTLGTRGSRLRFAVWGEGQVSQIIWEEELVPNQWYHVAAVTGSDGMRLYLDSVLVGTNAFTGGFSAIENPARNYLGQTVNPADPDTLFDGQITEVRVWSTARTQAEIRDDLFAQLTGAEPGLVGYWTFNDGTANDSSPGRHHGTLEGSAAVEVARRSSVQEFIVPALITGKVLDANGRPLRNADVIVLQAGAEVATARSSITGEYRTSIFKPNDQPYDIRVTKEDLANAMTGLNLSGGGNQAFNFTLYEAPGVSGRIRSPDNRPRAGVKVQLERADDRQVVGTVLSTSRGEYRFKNLVPGVYRLKVAGPEGPVYYPDATELLEVAERAPLRQTDVVIGPETVPAPAPDSINHVLKLDGEGGYVALPANAFNTLTEATVEGWVKWERFSNDTRFFDFGTESHAMTVNNAQTNNNLRLELWSPRGQNHLALLPDALELGRWYHVAVATGPEGTKLHLNGLLVYSGEFTGSFSSLSAQQNNYLGRNNWEGVVDNLGRFHGEMDEVRVWAAARSTEQIQSNLFQRLTGREEGLAGLWNFDDPEQPGRDATVNHLHGSLKETARIHPVPSPKDADVQLPAVVSGKVLDAKGDPLGGAQVSFKRENEPAINTVANSRGEYRLHVSDPVRPFDLSALLNQQPAPLRLYLTNLVAHLGETNLDLTLREFASLFGKVQSLDQKPLESIMVQAVTHQKLGRVFSETGFLAEYYQLDSAPSLSSGELPTLPPDRTPDLVQTNEFIDMANTNQQTRSPSESRFTTNFMVRWTGSIRIDSEQQVTFKLLGDDVAKLYVDDVLQVETVYNKGEQTGGRSLSPGLHSIRLEYLQVGGAFNCRLLWEGDDLPDEPVTTANLLVQTSYTDDRGAYRFPRLEEGDYSIRVVTHDGHFYADSPAGSVSFPSLSVPPPDGSKPIEASARREFSVKDGLETGDIDLRIKPFKKGNWVTYTRADGLAHDQIFAIHETREGVLWLGTLGGGVSRWDGRTFVNYSKVDGLHTDQVFSIAEDAEGGIWFGHGQEGVSRWDGRTFSHYSATNGLPHNQANGMKLDRDGRFWLATQSGAARWTGSGFEVLKKADGLAHDGVNDILQTRDGRLWFATDGGLTVRSGTNYHNYTAADGLIRNGVGRMAETIDGTLWIDNDGPELIRYDGTNFTSLAADAGMPDTGYVSLTADRDGAVWFGTLDRGVYRWNGTNLVNYTTADGLPENRVHAIHEDRDGVMWFGTFSGGLSRFNPNGFIRYSEGDGLIKNEITDLLEDAEGRLWIATTGGISVWDGDEFKNYTTANGLAHNTVLSIEEGDGAKLWFGTVRGISEWDGHQFQTRVQDAVTPNEKGRRNVILCLHRDDKGLLWAGTQLGLSRWDGQRFEYYTQADGLADDVVPAIAEDDGNLWLGHYGAGLTQWDGTRFRVLTQADGGLPNNRVISLFKAHDGSLWIGHDPGGISRYDGTNFVNYTAAEGLQGSFVGATLQDQQGVLWFAHKREVALFDGSAWSSFGVEDGLAENDTAQVRAFCETRDGTMWIGTTSGLYRYQKRPPPTGKPSLGIKLDREYKDLAGFPSQSIDTRLTFQFSYTDHLTRPNKQQFRYQVVPGEPGLESLKQRANWSAPMNATQVDWRTNVPGRYTFAVQYINQDLQYSEPSLATITLERPWHASLAIMVPAGAGVAGLLGWAFVARFLYGHKRREAERLREQLLAEEHRAKEALETKATQLAESNRQLRSAKEAADAANTAKSLFLANMSHEIRTPMNAILGYSQILKRDKELPPKHRQSIETIENSGDHLLGMINDILDLSKIEAGRMELQGADFDLNELISGIATMFRMRCEEKELLLNVVGFADGPIPVHGDEGKLRQVLINLLGNAVKFSDQGEVTLKIRPVNQTGRDAVKRAPTVYRFDVIDTGPGISAADQNEIFQPFQQSEAGLKKGGTGLGLAITRRQVELMGGEVKLESALGKGSRFYFEIDLPPAQGRLESQQAGETREVARLAAGSQVNALVVDDNQNNRDVLSQLLLGIGCRVRLAESALEAFDRVKEEVPDIIFMDIRMPGMNGAEATRRIIAEHGPDQIKIVAITASVLEHEKAGHMAAGFHSFLSKPFRFPDVCTSLKQLLKVEFDYAEEADEAAAAVEEMDPSGYSIPKNVWEALKQASDRYSLTGLKKGLEPLEQSGASGRKAAEALKRLIQEGDLERVSEFLEKVNQEEGKA